MKAYAYRALFEPGDRRGNVVVTFPDVPEVVTQGRGEADARTMAEEALGLVLLTYLARGLQLPKARAKGRDLVQITVAPDVAAKLAVLESFKAAGISKSELARRIGKNPVARRTSSGKADIEAIGLSGKRRLCLGAVWEHGVRGSAQVIADAAHEVSNIAALADIVGADQVRDSTQKVVRLGNLQIVELLGGKRRDRDRYLLQVFHAPLGRDDNFFELLRRSCPDKAGQANCREQSRQQSLPEVIRQLLMLRLEGGFDFSPANSPVAAVDFHNQMLLERSAVIT